MSQKRVLVLTDHMPWGHRAIARAIFGYLKKREKDLGWKVDYAQVRAELGVGNDVYTFLCRYMPGTHRIAHKIGSLLASQKELFEDIAKKSLPELKKTINRYKPDVVICSYFLLSHCLDSWRREENKNFVLMTVVADPRTINPVSFVPGADVNLVYDEAGVKLGLKWGISPERVLATGWWTREEMFDPQLRIANYKLRIKQRLGFGNDRPIIFVGGGSLGNSSLVKILASLMLVKTPVGLVINTGTDKVSYNLVEEYIRLFKRVRKGNLVQIKNMGWIDNMGEVLSACDIVFGKAGPNFLFDVVAVGRPFVATTHIGGQEDGNIDLIREKKLGWIKEKKWEISDFLVNYLKRPQWYNQRYLESIKKEADRNKKSLLLVERVVKKYLPKG